MINSTSVRLNCNSGWMCTVFWFHFIWVWQQLVYLLALCLSLSCDSDTVCFSTTYGFILRSWFSKTDMHGLDISQCLSFADFTHKNDQKTPNLYQPYTMSKHSWTWESMVPSFESFPITNFRILPKPDLISWISNTYTTWPQCQINFSSWIDNKQAVNWSTIRWKVTICPSSTSFW